MAMIVKSGGRKEIFSPQKVKNSIMKAALDAGLTDARSKKISNAVYKDVSATVRDGGTMETADLRDCILGDLSSMAPSVAKAWRSFDKRYKECLKKPT